MYINTDYSIGTTVYFLSGGTTVTRGEVREIHISKYEHGQHVFYSVAFINADGEQDETRMSADSLHRAADHAFWEYDRCHPQESSSEDVAA